MKLKKVPDWMASQLAYHVPLCKDEGDDRLDGFYIEQMGSCAADDPRHLMVVFVGGRRWDADTLRDIADFLDANTEAIQ